MENSVHSTGIMERDTVLLITKLHTVIKQSDCDYVTSQCRHGIQREQVYAECCQQGTKKGMKSPKIFRKMTEIMYEGFPLER